MIILPNLGLWQLERLEWKNELLDNINNKFKLISGSNDPLIYKEKSKIDLRMEVYQLNQKVRINKNIFDR